MTLIQMIAQLSGTQGGSMKVYVESKEQILEKLGKDDVEQTKRRGKKLVVVDPEAADRYHDRCDRVNE